MAKYEKFVFKELPKSLVVNSYDTSEAADSSDELITAAVTQHLSTIVGDPGVDDPLTALNIAHKTEEEAIIDVEKIKLDHYNKGLDDARQQYETVISDLQQEVDLKEVLRQKLLEITPQFNLDEEVARLSSEMIANIAKKVYLVLPVNFEQMLKDSMISRLKKTYKEGNVTITVNPERQDLCKQLLKVEELPSNLIEAISIKTDENLGKDDCKLEWNNTKLEYNPEQLSFEIDQILEQLRSAA
jgi:flagellar biosynthesis/type III secretory pathway protein FliH